jgi:5-hydroxyisourate hydrolase-like protein (transthyretin family)
LFWSLRAPVRVQIRLFDVTGRSVRTFVDGTTPAGSYRTQLDTRRLAHGIYVLKIKAGDYRKAYKLVLE